LEQFDDLFFAQLRWHAIRHAALCTCWASDAVCYLLLQESACSFIDLMRPLACARFAIGGSGTTVAIGLVRGVHPDPAGLAPSDSSWNTPPHTTFHRCLKLRLLSWLDRGLVHAVQ
jgi:hypothetical protein